MQYDFAMVVGRFQPFQNAHLKLVNYALEQGKKVIIVLGSAHSTSTVKNPFTPKEREQMIRACFDEATQKRLVFAAVRDYPYNENLWIAEMQNIANEVLFESEELNPKMALVGHFKDKSSYYLNLFPQWKLVNFEAHTHNNKVLNATDIRSLYLSLEDTYTPETETRLRQIVEMVPVPVYTYMCNFANTNTYKDLVKEFEYIEKYKADSKYVGMNFAPTFVTTDALVTALGHVLVVKRGHHPGRGKLALPGGFLAGDATLEENALKELREETDIKVPKQILQSNIVGSHVFDHPERSLRGRTITQAFHIELNPNLEDGLPRVKGGDDADKAMWIPIADLRMKEDEFFEDHFSIIQKFLGF